MHGEGVDAAEKSWSAMTPALLQAQSAIDTDRWRGFAGVKRFGLFAAERIVATGATFRAAPVDGRISLSHWQDSCRARLREGEAGGSVDG